MLKQLFQHALASALNRPKVRRALNWVAQQSLAGQGQQGTQTPNQNFQNQLGNTLNQVFVNLQTSKQFLKYTRVLPGDVVPTSEEQWLRQGDKFVKVVEKTKVTTQSGEIVPAEEVVSQCFVCKGFSAIPLNCSECGASVCRLHGRIIQDPIVTGCFCPTCFERVMDTYNSWRSFDLKRAAVLQESVKSKAPVKPVKQ